MSHSQLNQPKRGYIANILTLPPLIYPFQYNPSKLVDTKNVKWRRRNATPNPLEGLSTAFGSGVGLVDRAGGLFSAVGDTKTLLAKTFSKADMLQLEKEQGRTISFSFFIDGREHRPGEPERRREDGNILPDIAILRSFTYPKIADVLELVKSFGDSGQSPWFNAPPTMTLILGDMSVEGYVTQMKITEEKFNQDLDPVRAKVSITMTENIDSFSFVIDSFKRIGRSAYHSAYEDFGKVLF